MSLDGLVGLRPPPPPGAMGYAPPPSRELPFREVPRAARLDASDDAVFLAWLAEPTGRTLQEFCAAEWTNRPALPAPRFDPPRPIAPANIELSDRGLKRAALEAAREVRALPEDPAELDRFLACMAADLLEGPGRPLRLQRSLVLEPAFVRGRLVDPDAVNAALDRALAASLEAPAPAAPRSRLAARSAAIVRGIGRYLAECWHGLVWALGPGPSRAGDRLPPKPPPPPAPPRPS